MSRASRAHCSFPENLQCAYGMHVGRKCILLGGPIRAYHSLGVPKFIIIIIIGNTILCKYCLQSGAKIIETTA